MPLYDYRCPGGHVTECRGSIEQKSIACAECGQDAYRVVLASHAARAIGWASRPTREAPIRLGQAIEAQHELVYTAERHGIEPPDLLAAAKDRIRRGDVKAIENK